MTGAASCCGHLQAGKQQVKWAPDTHLTSLAFDQELGLGGCRCQTDSRCLLHLADSQCRICTCTLLLNHPPNAAITGKARRTLKASLIRMHSRDIETHCSKALAVQATLICKARIQSHLQHAWHGRVPEWVNGALHMWPWHHVGALSWNASFKVTPPIRLDRRTPVPANLET